MKPVKKAKVSVTVDPHLLAAIDRVAALGSTRSQVIEDWLRLAAQEQARRELDAATAAYYEGRSEVQSAEDRALAAASTRVSRRRDLDGSRTRRRRRKP